jgi:hypothetical protein
LSSLLSKSLEVTFDNLNMASTILAYAEDAAEELNLTLKFANVWHWSTRGWQWQRKHWSQKTRIV